MKGGAAPTSRASVLREMEKSMTASRAYRVVGQQGANSSQYLAREAIQARRMMHSSVSAAPSSFFHSRHLSVRRKAMAFPVPGMLLPNLQTLRHHRVCAGSFETRYRDALVQSIRALVDVGIKDRVFSGARRTILGNGKAGLHGQRRSGVQHCCAECRWIIEADECLTR